jgi:hypothetical protein
MVGKVYKRGSARARWWLNDAAAERSALWSEMRRLVAQAVGRTVGDASSDNRAMLRRLKRQLSCLLLNDNLGAMRDCKVALRKQRKVWAQTGRR